ncbi:hypothetical protein A3860_13065 [Niastella vici]|uniref:Beta-lactamase-inhibitor-like PepSY-like domain-containing protein n=1 Tax=Niastella vici TaxID=1703345 RepID=A0A1V9G766_9BACT|nr:hypothetical protein [Niastella vici]OQP66417.1 hypothetical protein A3860_13065 [Niastella vici]
MKILLFVCSFLLSAVTCCWCQQDDKIDWDYIRINHLSQGDHKTTIIKTFGKPAKIEKVQSMDDEWYAYHYKNSIIQVSPDGYLQGFEIYDTNFVLTYKSTKIKVGDSIAILKKMFPGSYKDYLKEKSGYFRLQFGDSDEYLFFIIKNNRIAHFKNWFDNT